jgi:uncharacterized protein YndB with AHSA1/START domain
MAKKVTTTRSTESGTKPAESRNSASDEAVQAATSRTWDQWFQILDKAGCEQMKHKEIVEVVARHLGNAWWQQSITVGYERARGLRQLNQKADGGFQASGSKTINVPVERLFEAWNSAPLRRKWLGPKEQDLEIRKATPPKSLRITWTDGSSVSVQLYPKGDSKSSVSLEHTKLKSPTEVEKVKKSWAERLERLKQVLEGPPPA